MTGRNRLITLNKQTLIGVGMGGEKLRRLAAPCLGMLLAGYCNIALAIFDTEAEAKAKCDAFIQQNPSHFCQRVVLPPVDYPPGNKYQIGYWQAQLPGWYTFTTSWGWYVYRTPPAPPPPPPKVVALDPGHGFTCPSRGMKPGAVGVTDFPPSNPPAGRLHEDSLTVAFALEAEKALRSRYKVVLTKRDVDACPSFLARGRIANNANAKVFVSIHVDAKANALREHGALALYNRDKAATSPSISVNLAVSMSQRVAQSLGVNNRGIQVDEELAVLKPTVTSMDAVLIEVARLSGRDEEILHSSSAAGRVAEGISAAVYENLGN